MCGKEQTVKIDKNINNIIFIQTIKDVEITLIKGNYQLYYFISQITKLNIFTKVIGADIKFNIETADCNIFIIGSL